jgi:secondary thiamine-phosphate synthase enzyme
MQIKNEVIEVETDNGICIYNITPQILKILDATSVKNGQILVFSRHTTTALAINENEERLLEDVKIHLEKLAPPDARYLHNQGNRILIEFSNYCKCLENLTAQFQL